MNENTIERFIFITVWAGISLFCALFWGGILSIISPIIGLTVGFFCFIIVFGFCCIMKVV